MSSLGRPGHCACRESHPWRRAAELRCRRPGSEEPTDGLGELISVGAGSLGAACPGTRSGQQSAPGVACDPLLPVSRAAAAAVAGGAVLASGIAASRSPACVRGGECGQGRCPLAREPGAAALSRPAASVK